MRSTSAATAATSTRSLGLGDLHEQPEPGVRARDVTAEMLESTAAQHYDDVVSTGLILGPGSGQPPLARPTPSD